MKRGNGIRFLLAKCAFRRLKFDNVGKNASRARRIKSSSAACGVAGVPADLRIYGLSEHIVLRRPPSPGIYQYRPSAALQEFLTFCAVKNNEGPRKKRRMPSKEHGKSPRQEDWYLDVPYRERDQFKQRRGRWDEAKRRWYIPAGEDITFS